MTLKAFKGALRVGGCISAVDHWIRNQRHTLRTIVEIQGNGYWYTQEGESLRWWAKFPKASQIHFEGTVARIRLDERRCWTLDFAPNGIVDHYRWERIRGQENECDGERRMAEDAQARGANMTTWWRQWFERSDAWGEEIGHENDGAPERAELPEGSGRHPTSDPPAPVEPT